MRRTVQRLKEVTLTFEYRYPREIEPEPDYSLTFHDVHERITPEDYERLYAKDIEPTLKRKSFITVPKKVEHKKVPKYGK